MRSSNKKILCIPFDLGNADYIRNNYELLCKGLEKLIKRDGSCLFVMLTMDDMSNM